MWREKIHIDGLKQNVTTHAMSFQRFVYAVANFRSAIRANLIFISVTSRRHQDDPIVVNIIGCVISMEVVKMSFHDALDKRIILLRKSGKTYCAIAEELSISRVTLWKALKRGRMINHARFKKPCSKSKNKSMHEDAELVAALFMEHPSRACLLKSTGDVVRDGSQFRSIPRINVSSSSSIYGSPAASCVSCVNRGLR